MRRLDKPKLFVGVRTLMESLALAQTIKGLVNQGGNPLLKNASISLSLSSSTVLDIKSGRYHACILISDNSATNKVRCWGKALALGTTDDPSRGHNPRHDAGNFVTDPLNFGDLNPVELALGNDFTCVLFDTEIVKCWGDIRNATLGPQPQPPPPPLLPPLFTTTEDALKIDLGVGRSATRIFSGPSANHACATLDYDLKRRWSYRYQMLGWKWPWTTRFRRY